jgi:leukotriene-A4 hydrolase
MPISIQPARLALAALLSAAFCAHADPLSYAHPEQVRTTDLYLDLKADFNHRTLSGYAELTPMS